MKIDLDIRELTDPDGTRYWRVVVVDREEQVHRAIEWRQGENPNIKDPAGYRRAQFMALIAEVSRAIGNRFLDGESSLDSFPTVH